MRWPSFGNVRAHSLVVIAVDWNGGGAGRQNGVVGTLIVAEGEPELGRIVAE